MTREGIRWGGVNVERLPKTSVLVTKMNRSSQNNTFRDGQAKGNH